MTWTVIAKLPLGNNFGVMQYNAFRECRVGKLNQRTGTITASNATDEDLWLFSAAAEEAGRDGDVDGVREFQKLGDKADERSAMQTDVMVGLYGNGGRRIVDATKYINIWGGSVRGGWKMLG